MTATLLVYILWMESPPRRVSESSSTSSCTRLATWIISVICPSPACFAYAVSASGPFGGGGSAASALDTSMTIVGRNRLPCRLWKKWLAARDRTGCSISTSSAMASENGAISAETGVGRVS